MGKNSYTYHVLKDKNLVIEILRGDFNLADFINLKKTESRDPAFDPNYNSILDIRNVRNAFSKEIRDDLKEYQGIINTIQTITKRRKAAVITSKPAQVAGIMWYQMIDSRGIEYKTFSTLQAAAMWLGVSDINLRKIDPGLKDNL
jgi:hypothetical protein